MKAKVRALLSIIGLGVCGLALLHAPGIAANPSDRNDALNPQSQQSTLYPGLLKSTGPVKAGPTPQLTQVTPPTLASTLAAPQLIVSIAREVPVPESIEQGSVDLTVQPPAQATATPAAPYPGPQLLPQSTVTPLPTITPLPTETPKPPCDRSDPDSMCSANVTVFVFVDRVGRGGCDTFFNDGADFPLPGARVTFFRPDGGVEQKTTPRFGYLSFSENVNFLPGDDAHLEVEFPAKYRGSVLVPCPNSPTRKTITAEDFGALRPTQVVFRAFFVLPSPTPTSTPTKTATSGASISVGFGVSADSGLKASRFVSGAAWPACRYRP